MLSIADTLKILIATCEDLVRQPYKATTLAHTAFPEIAAEVRKFDQQPAEGVRTTAAAMVMIISIEKLAEGPHEKGSPWLMLIGATLPILRAEAWLAMTNEREARG